MARPFDEVFQALHGSLPANSLIIICGAGGARLIGRLNAIDGRGAGQLFARARATVEGQIEQFRKQARDQGGPAALAEFERGLADPIGEQWNAYKDARPGG